LQRWLSCSRWAPPWPPHRYRPRCGCGCRVVRGRCGETCGEGSAGGGSRSRRRFVSF
jgi:hypothetical protein